MCSRSVIHLFFPPILLSQTMRNTGDQVVNKPHSLLLWNLIDCRVVIQINCSMMEGVTGCVERAMWVHRNCTQLNFGEAGKKKFTEDLKDKQSWPSTGVGGKVKHQRRGVGKLQRLEARKNLACDYSPLGRRVGRTEKWGRSSRSQIAKSYLYKPGQGVWIWFQGQWGLMSGSALRDIKEKSKFRSETELQYHIWNHISSQMQLAYPNRVSFALLLTVSLA